MNYEIREGSRSHAKPLIGLYAESGTGKTYSALLMARGFVGPQGRICMIETESGRGEAYADKNEYPEIGGYDVLSMRDNFSPENYGQAIAAVEKGKYDALIIDSASHEWEGAGGVLDKAAENMKTKKGLLVWQEPKISHQKNFMLKFMQTPLPLVILCMRAKYPMIEVYNEQKGRKEPQRSDILEPKQSEDILYEMFVHGWIDKAHKFHPTKVTASSLKPVFPDGGMLSIETGQKLAQWAKGVSATPAQSSAPELTPIQKTTNRIALAIDSCLNAIDLESCWNEDYKDDIALVQIEKPKFYDALKTKYDEKMKSFPPDYSQA